MNIKKRSYAGIDISKDTFNVHFKSADRKYKNNRQGWQKLLKDFPPGVIYAMEATGNYHYKLAAYLHSKGCSVLVFNPYRVRLWVWSFKGRKDKTDKIDASDIANYANRKEINHHEWQPMSPKHARARVIVSILNGLSRLEKSAGNINHAASLVTGKSDSLLNAMSDVSNVCGDYQKSLEKELSKLTSEIFPDKFRLLKTIPGIGEKIASVMLVCAKGLEFETQRNLSSFVGLAPMIYESGTSVKGKGRIGKTGNPYLRSLLYMGSMSAIKYCKPCTELYDRLLSKGKPKKLAQIAVMHRLAKIAFGVVRSGEPYRGNNPV